MQGGGRAGAGAADEGETWEWFQRAVNGTETERKREKERSEEHRDNIRNTKPLPSCGLMAVMVGISRSSLYVVLSRLIASLPQRWLAYRITGSPSQSTID